VNAAKAFGVDVQNNAAEGGVTGFAIAVDGVATSAAPTPTASTVVDVVAPAALGTRTLVVTWEQTAGAGRPGSPACSGRIEQSLTVVRRGARIGDVDQPRVDGTWTLVVTPLNWPGRTETHRWTPSPLCTVGACDFRGDDRGVVFSTDDGVAYAWVDDVVRPAGQCPVPRYAGGRFAGWRWIPRAYLARVETRLRVVRSRQLPSGLLSATRVEGTQLITLIPTGEARSKGCRRTVRMRSRAVAVRR
jgi:hypothetical protein